mgnify:CR=1 FL=1
MKMREDIENSYEIAGVIVDEVLPYSLEYFLGIEHEGDENFDEEDEDGEDNDDDVSSTWITSTSASAKAE